MIGAMCVIEDVPPTFCRLKPGQLGLLAGLQWLLFGIWNARVPTRTIMEDLFSRSGLDP